VITPFSATQLFSELEQVEKSIVDALKDPDLSAETFKILLDASSKLFIMRMGLIPFVMAAKNDEGGAN
jgi:hypothetical protein